MIENNSKDTNSNIDGIVRQRYGENTYTFWHKADVVYHYISKFLKKKYSNSIILREFNKIDYVILKESLPCEVQSTPAYNYERQTIAHSDFEQKIEKQLKQNIDKYGKCLFFFDSEYLRYLQNDITSASRINWDWLYRSIKEGKLIIFIVRYNGIIKEVSLKDFEFISKISQTCPLSRDSDERILERNKLNIMSNVLEWYKFTTDETDKMYDTFKSSRAQFHDYDEWLNRNGHTSRETEYYYITHAMTTLRYINDILDCKIEKRSNIRTYSHYMKVLGLIDAKDTGKTAQMRKFVDFSNIAQYFPGYLRNKDIWDDLKIRWTSYDSFCGMVTGQFDRNWWKRQKSIDNAWE